jgi:hypothetical protein
MTTENLSLGQIIIPLLDSRSLHWLYITKSVGSRRAVATRSNIKQRIANKTLLTAYAESLTLPPEDARVMDHEMTDTLPWNRAEACQVVGERIVRIQSDFGATIGNLDVLADFTRTQSVSFADLIALADKHAATVMDGWPQTRGEDAAVKVATPQSPTPGTPMIAPSPPKPLAPLAPLAPLRPPTPKPLAPPPPPRETYNPEEAERLGALLNEASERHTEACDAYETEKAAIRAGVSMANEAYDASGVPCETSEYFDRDNPVHIDMRDRYTEDIEELQRRQDALSTLNENIIAAHRAMEAARIPYNRAIALYQET